MVKLLIKSILDSYFEKTQGFYPFFKYCPKQFHNYYINLRASKTLGYEYNFLEPRSLNEKIRYLLYEDTILKGYLSDKIKVKTYIYEIIGDGHVAPIYGIWNNFDEIEFSYLPNNFVLKTNHACNTNIIITNKQHLIQNRNSIKKIINSWLKIHYDEYSLEPQYKCIKPKILIEKYLLNTNNWEDFQVHCINSEPYMIEVTQKDGTSQFYDTDWKSLPIVFRKNKLQNTTPKPIFLKEMIEYSKKLSKNFKYVRIDFAGIPDKTIIYEMSFSPFSAMIPFNDKSIDFELGELLKI